MPKSEESRRCEGKRNHVLILLALVGAVCLAKGHMGTFLSTMYSFNESLRHTSLDSASFSVCWSEDQREMLMLRDTSAQTKSK